MVRRPMTYAAAASAAAITVCFYAGILFAAVIGLAFTVVLLDGKRKETFLYIVIVFYLMSVINYQLFELKDREMPELAGSSHAISGKIISIERKENGNGQRFIQMKVDVNETDDRRLKEDERILLKYYGLVNGDRLVEDYSAAAPSDLIKAYIDVEIPSGRRNPGGFDYALHLRTLGIDVTANAKKIYYVEKDRTIISQICRMLFMKKEAYLNRLSSAAGSEASSLMRAILFGEKYELDEDVVEDFRKNGIAHILAVSGLHIGIIYAFFNTVWIWKKNRLYFTGVMAFFAGYMFLASFSPSVVRAVCMIGLHMAAQLTNRRYDIISAALLVLTIMIFANPLILFNMGLQLSFLAVLSIAVILPIIRKIYNGVYLSSLAVQAGLMPYMIYMFNCFSPMAVFINYPVVLLAGIIVPIGITAMLVSELSSSLFGALSVIVGELSGMLIKMSSYVSIDNLTVFYVCSPDTGMLCACYLILFVFLSEEGRVLFLRRKKKPIMILTAAVLFISVVFGSVASDPVRKSELLFLDVGQGDAVHLRVRDGVFGYDGLAGTGMFTCEKNYLFDGGGSDSYNVGKKVLKPYLLKNGIRKLDGVFVTHLHTDHYKGIVELCHEGMVNRLYLYEANRYKMQEIMDETGLDADSLVFLHQGNTVQFGGSRAEILWPERKTESEYIEMISDEENENDMSMIIKIYHRNMSALITGDIDETLMNTLAELHKHDSQLQSDILKVPHHGSKYSWNEEFIDKVSPEYAVIQSGRNNYGHPAPEIVENYFKKNIKVLRNDQQGAVGFFENNNNEVKAESMK